MCEDTKTRKYSRKSKEKKTEKQPRGEKSIRIFFPELSYARLVNDTNAYREFLDAQYALHPEVFPQGFSEGYAFHDKRASSKIKGLEIRRVKLKNGEVYSIIATDNLPYLVGNVPDVEKGLVLRRYGVPYEVIAYVLGRNGMYWERIEDSLGRIGLVGSICKGDLPEHLAADEKISHWNGKEIYIAMTASGDCLLGAELSMSEDEIGLKEAYGVFMDEAQGIQSTYAPKSVNLDGWKATNKAWKVLFPNIVVILCYLHSFIKVRSIAKNLKEQYTEICAKIWECYAQQTAVEFAQSLTNLKDWATEKLKSQQNVLSKITEIAEKSARFEVFYQCPDAYRTSNQIDRPMNEFDRYLYNMKYFHGHRDTANQKIRGWAILYNFAPFSRKTKLKKKVVSRFEQHNQWVYHQHWLHNLLMAASCNAKNLNHKIR